MMDLLLLLNDLIEKTSNYWKKSSKADKWRRLSVTLFFLLGSVLYTNFLFFVESYKGQLKFQQDTFMNEQKFKTDSTVLAFKFKMRIEHLESKTQTIVVEKDFYKSNMQLIRERVLNPISNNDCQKSLESVRLIAIQTVIHSAILPPGSKLPLEPDPF